MAFIRGLITKLQGRTLDIVAAYKSVSEEALTHVRKTIDERFSEWFADTEELAKTVAVEPSIPRRCGRQTQREKLSCRYTRNLLQTCHRYPIL